MNLERAIMASTFHGECAIQCHGSIMLNHASITKPSIMFNHASQTIYDTTTLTTQYTYFFYYMRMESMQVTMKHFSTHSVSSYALLFLQAPILEYRPLGTRGASGGAQPGVEFQDDSFRGGGGAKKTKGYSQLSLRRHILSDRSDSFDLEKIQLM